MNTVPEEHVGELVRLRVLVLALGERSPVLWWHTQFFSEAGRSFLERIYPRTHWLAALRAAGAAARDLHDASIGRRQVFHLFRLPVEIERGIEAALPKAMTAWPQFADGLASPGSWTSELDSFGTLPGHAPVGPTSLGKLQDLRRPEAVRKMAGYYRLALKNGQKVFPYYEG